MTVLLTSLRPTKKALGGTALRQQLALRIQLPVIEAQDADLILGYGMRAGGWDPRLLDEPGKMLVFAPPEHSRPKPYKGHWISKADAIALDAEYARLPLPQLEVAVGPPKRPPPGPPGRPAGRPADDPPDRPPDSPPASPVGNGHRPAGPVGQGDPMVALLDALAEAGERGARAEELAARINRSRTWTYERLQELDRAGRVTRIRPAGRWRLKEAGG